MAVTVTLSIESLLTHAGSLDRLARVLVRDGAELQAAAQEVWLAARSRPPASDRPPRQWLAQVVAAVNSQERGRRRSSASPTGCRR
jgi:DNA-directed RNA polymerase specialized sigma24 family protein